MHGAKPGRRGCRCSRYRPRIGRRRATPTGISALIQRASLFSFGALLISQARFILTAPWLIVFAPLLALTVIYYVISLFVNLGTRGFDMESHRALVQAWRPSSYPSLDVFLPICGEPMEILHNTWRYVAELVRSYPGVAIAYVLDDGASDQAAAMANDFGFELSCPGEPRLLQEGGKPAECLRPLVRGVPPHPRRGLHASLRPALGDAAVLRKDPTLGIVQSPQYFRVDNSQSWTEREPGAVQELFYRHGASLP